MVFHLEKSFDVLIFKPVLERTNGCGWKKRKQNKNGEKTEIQTREMYTQMHTDGEKEILRKKIIEN